MFQIGVFWEEGFPAADTSPQALNGIRRALDGFDVRVLGYTDLERLPGVDLLILPFGSAFPALGWPLLQVYLRSGGNLLNLGGAPFSVPCTRQHVVWKRQARQAAYHREMGIRYYHEVDADRVATLEIPPEEPILTGLRDTIRARALFAMVPAPRAGDAHGVAASATLLRPLLYGLDAAGRRVAAPITALDHVGGPFHGGRWVFATLDGSLSIEVIRRLAFYAAQGATDLTVSSSFPCYYPGETPRLRVHASLFGNVPGIQKTAVAVTDPDGNRTTRELPAIDYRDRPAYRWSECDGSLFGHAPLPPGLHLIEASLSSSETRDLALRLRLPPAAQADTRRHRAAFRVWDPALMSGPPTLAAGHSYLRREGHSGPVLGAAYSLPAGMALAAQPDPYRWDRELRLMGEMGIRVVRADLRAIWADSAPRCPPVDEGSLRAVDAFLLAARAYGLHVILAPLEAEGGTPDDAGDLVDPRRLDAQRDLLGAFVARYRSVPGIIWEVDEAPYPLPSSDGTKTDRLGHARVDAAWREWIAARDETELRAQWRVTTEDSLGLAGPGEEGVPHGGSEGGAKELDYRLFTREIESRWLREMRESVRVHGSTSALIAVGPAGEAPVPTVTLPPPPATADLAITPTLRTDEDVLCEAVLAKAAGGPSLTAVAGGRLAGDPGGALRTTEEMVRDRVERMLAIAVATGSAGALYRPWSPGSLGHAVLSAGLVRVDGTVTPALEAVSHLAEFLDRNQHRMEEPLPSPVAMVVPSSRLLRAPARGALAITQCIRTLHYRNGMSLRAVGEYHLQELGDARLILLPSPRVLHQDAWEALLARVDAGACLLVTGPIDRDPYWQRRDRLSQFELHVTAQPVAPEETLSLYGDAVHLRFGGAKPEWVDKAVVQGCEPQVTVLAHGQGRLLFAPLPIELADNPEPLAELYDAAIAESGVERPFELEPRGSGVLAIPLHFEDTALYALVSQTDEERSTMLRHGPDRVPIPVTVPAQRAVLLLVERATGTVLDRYSPLGAGS